MTTLDDVVDIAMTTVAAAVLTNHKNIIVTLNTIAVRFCARSSPHSHLHLHAQWAVFATVDVSSVLTRSGNVVWSRREQECAVDDGEPYWATNCEGKRHYTRTFRRTEYIFCSSFLISIIEWSLLHTSFWQWIRLRFCDAQNVRCQVLCGIAVTESCVDLRKYLCPFIQNKSLVRPFSRRRAGNNDCHQPPGSDMLFVFCPQIFFSLFSFSSSSSR